MEVPGTKSDGTVSKWTTNQDICHPCFTEYQLVPAVGFCQDCQHQLCQKCYDGHTIPLITRKHRLQLLSSTAAAQASPAASKAPVTKGTLTCPNHLDKVIEVYCTRHDSAVCATCIYKHHKSCDTEDLTAVPDDFYQSNDYFRLGDALRNYDTILDLIHSDADTNITDTEQSNDDAIKELNKIKNKIIVHFNQIEKDLITTGKQDKSTDVNSLNDIKAECQAMKSQLTQQQAELKRHDKNSVDLYVTSRHALKLVEKLKTQIESISQRNQSVSYRFKPDAFIQTITTGAKCLGIIERAMTPINIPSPIQVQRPTQLKHNIPQKVAVSQAPTSAQQKPEDVKKVQVPLTSTPSNLELAMHSSSTTKISAKLASAKVTRMTDVKVKGSHDNNTCHINGMALLSPSKLLVADRDNRSVKCVDTSTNTITSYLRLSSGPWDVTVLPDNLAAVTLPMENNIHILSTAGRLSPVYKIRVTGRCKCITSTATILIVSFVGSETRVDIMDLQGRVLRTIQYDLHGKHLFQSPRRVALSGDKGLEVIYVADWLTDTVSKLTMTGQVLLTHTDHALRYTCGLIVTHDEYMLVCSGYTSKVHLMSPRGEEMKTLISSEDGLNQPAAICANTEQNLIYISNYEQDSLNVYRIE